jgi:hypothetical protein
VTVANIVHLDTLQVDFLQGISNLSHFRCSASGLCRESQSKAVTRFDSLRLFTKLLTMKLASTSFLSALLLHAAAIVVAYGGNTKMDNNVVASTGEHVSRQLFIPSVSCYLGLKQFRTCLCQEDALRRAVAKAGSSTKTPTAITICAGTIELTEALNVTGKSIALSCDAPFYWTCDLSGKGKNRIFEGSPTLLSLNTVRLKEGSAKGSMVCDTICFHCVISAFYVPPTNARSIIAHHRAQTWQPWTSAPVVPCF